MVRKGDKNIKIQAGETDHHGYQTGKIKQWKLWTLKQVLLKLPMNSHWKEKWATPRTTAEEDVGKISYHKLIKYSPVRSVLRT